MKNRSMFKDYISESNIAHLFEIKGSKIGISVDVVKNSYYEYIFDIHNDKINWDSDKQNAALLSDDVINDANIFIRTYNMKIFI